MTTMDRATADPATVPARSHPDAPGEVVAPLALPAVARLDGAAQSRMLLSLSRAAGNAAVQRRAVGGARAVQRKPPPSKAELDSVIALMPIMKDLDALASAVTTECGRWRTWRGNLEGAQPGPGAFAAMDVFKGSIRLKGFDVSDVDVQQAARQRVTGDDRQLLTEMCSFALGSRTRAGGDYLGLAKLCGVETKALTHSYTLKISYSAQVKGQLGLGVGYTYRSASVEYANGFGMTYSKPLAMHSGGVSAGPSAGAKVKGKEVLDLPVTGGAGFEGEGTTESLSFWMPDDFETTFSVAKVAAGVVGGAKYEVKLLELVRVASDKHPALLFDLMGGKVITDEWGAELGAEIGGGAEVELGKMVAQEGAATTVSSPVLEEAKKNAEKAGLTKPDPKVPDWQVVGATVMSFGTGQAMPTVESQQLLWGFLRFVRRWATDNAATDVRFEIVGQASPRWRHPQKGQVPLDLNQKLSEERAAITKILLTGEWADDGAATTVTASGAPGPEQDMDDGKAAATGAGSLKGLAESRDPDNDDAAYRVASVTAWGKPAPAPEPPPPPSPIR